MVAYKIDRLSSSLTQFSRLMDIFDRHDVQLQGRLTPISRSRQYNVIHVFLSMTDMTTKTINVRLPEALYNQIEELAKATARTKSFLTIDALTNYVERESWQIRDIHEGVREADAGQFATDDEVKAVFAKYGA